MKKFIARTFLCTALAGVMCVSTAFAAGPVEVSKTGTDVTVKVTGLTGNEETTLFVVKSGTTIEDAFKDTTKVHYLDQTPADSSGTATFGFTYEGTDTLDIYSGYENMAIDADPLSAQLKDESDPGGDNTGEFTYGDVNNDGTIDVFDVTQVVNYILHETQFKDSKTGEEPYKYGSLAANVDGNGTIDVFDVTAIINKILHDTEFSVLQQ